MSEKKGFFGKLFGRDQDDLPEEDQAQAENQDTSPAPEEPVATEEETRTPEPVEEALTAETQDPEHGTGEEAPEEKRGFFKRLFGGDVPEAEEHTGHDAPGEDKALSLETAPEPPVATDTDETETAAPASDSDTPAPLDNRDALKAVIEEVYADTGAGPVTEPTDEAEAPATVPDETQAATREAPQQVPQQTPAPESPPAAPVEEGAGNKPGFFSRLKQGLSKTSSKLTGGVTSIFTKRRLDDETLEELEDLLITADLGMAATTRITTALAKDKFDKEVTDEEVRTVLADEIVSTLGPLEQPLEIQSGKKPHIILMTGVNGAGKTTTIGKLARKYRDEGKSVMLAAGDTFRAAAIEQLTVWGERVGAPVISREVGADAAGLVFDAIKAAQEQGIDVLMIDTAGRLQNRSELMDELAKIVRVIRKIDETAPHHTLLVLDATVGQNALSQTQSFTEIAGVTGLVMTKLDGTARGGVLVALADKFEIPVHYIGVGEGVEDLQPFNASQFAKALTGLEEIKRAS